MGLFDLFDDMNALKEGIKREIENNMPSRGSVLGDIIYEMQKEIDEQRQREQNRAEAPLNPFRHGEKKNSGFQEADHLLVRRGPITHHGLYIGANQVMHYGLSDNGKIEIHTVSLEEFADGGEIERLNERQSPIKYERNEVIHRAYHRLEESKYNLFENNCENFVRWCRNGGRVWDD